MLYPGSSYVLDLLALLPRVSHANIIKFSLTLISQASLLYNSSCKLCNQGVPEDAAHFVSTCPVLDDERVKLYSEAPPTIRSKIPGPRVHPQDFLEVMTGTCWVDDINVQKFCIHFLSELRATRTAFLFPSLILSLVLLILGQLSLLCFSTSYLSCK